MWRVDSDATSVDHYSAIVLLDAPSQRVLADAAAAVEQEVRTAAGVDVHVPRAEQEPFHATLAVVSGAAFPAVAVLAAVTGAVPPGTWTGPGGAPITLTKPGGF